MRKFSIGHCVRRASGGPVMRFGGVIEGTDLAYLTPLDHAESQCETVAEALLEAVPSTSTDSRAFQFDGYLDRSRNRMLAAMAMTGEA